MFFDIALKAVGIQLIYAFVVFVGSKIVKKTVGDKLEAADKKKGGLE